MVSTVPEARAAADRFFASDLIDGSLRREAAIGDPLPIRTRAGETAGWFVPLLAGERLLGFLQLDATLEFMRVSRFPDPAPHAKSWTDADAVRAIANARYPDVKTTGAPFLTYDRNVTRVVWAVPAETKTIFVAGDFAYIG